MTIKITTLSNGLRVATDSMHDAESVVVGAWVGVGTRNEPWKANGVAHLVEHMMFKGTKKRSSYALSTAIEKNGGMMNAHTTREETAYYARVLPEDAELACDIISDMLQYSTLKAKELEREKKVIIQEIGRDLDSPEEHIFDLAHQAAFPHQKIGRSILGSASVIEKMPRSVIRAYVKQYYHAGNMVVVAAGKVKHEEFVSMVKKRFGRLPRGKAPKNDKARIVSADKRKQKRIEQLHLIMGFAGPGFHSRDIFAAQVLSIILGGSSSSRLFQKVREKRGLVYTISSNHIAFSDAGFFQIYAGTDPARAKELVPVICNELRDITKNITPAELDRAKAQGRADMLMGQENVMRRAEVLGHQLLAYGRPIAIDEILKKLMAVKVKDVQLMAKKLFKRRPIITALGPLAELEDYKGILKRLP
ncbi:MAG: pitrilysin family protein [Alphaproteobacteria bacterium]